MADAINIPDVIESEDGWQRYVSEIPVSPEARVPPTSAEAAVVSFYASRMRGDEEWGALLEDEPSDSMLRKLKKLESWTFQGVELLARKPRSRGRFYIRIRQSVTIDGTPDEAINEVSVVTVGEGQFRLNRVPT